MSRLAAREGIPLTVDGCDVSERAIALARRRANAARVESRFFTLNAIRDALPGDYDVVMCSLFLHHLDDQDAVDTLYKMRSAARRMVVVSDLRRSRLGLALAYAASRVFSRSRVVRTDAILSVKAAWEEDEFQAMAHEAGLDGAVIHPVWPQRWLLVWRRP
jgi:2-polyprenyl-3-methyl-5-hydroxy-6-metoxy-1,4-benzoquinol methylase